LSVPRPEKQELELEEEDYDFVGPEADEQVMWLVLVRWLHKDTCEKMRRHEIQTSTTSSQSGASTLHEECRQARFHNFVNSAFPPSV
jgi:hypothetical protein